ncbi:sirohydrochlorin chelatase [Noviherbaspirillum massiliense]|uniref:sirohydrochlorin chelatase n=1 Tax=Noviherbaspirillum massiliense TaxID=1465823 RepID=UPI0002EF6835|nr:CbiX/SirB N-terminal domain-containing protein [Noviherbaspirillum massiliense]
MTRRAMILFAHGARDPRWATPFRRLQQIVQAQAPDVPIELAFLEMMPPELASVVLQLQQAGCDDIMIVPVFFGQGGHVLRDLPLMISQLQKQYPGLNIRAAEAVGESPDVLNAIARYCLGTLDNQ